MTPLGDGLPYEEIDGQTHHDLCWSQQRHHNCAVRRVHELEARVTELEAAGDELVLGSHRIGESIGYARGLDEAARIAMANNQPDLAHRISKRREGE